MTEMTTDSDRPSRTIQLGTHGSSIEILATAAETAGTMNLYRWRMAPTSGGPDPHFHTTFSETFIVEEGEIDYFDGKVWQTIGPGRTVHAAKGEVHALRKGRAAAVTIVMALVPGTAREEYFAQLALTDDADLSDLHDRHDNHFVVDDRR